MRMPQVMRPNARHTTSFHEFLAWGQFRTEWMDCSLAGAKAHRCHYPHHSGFASGGPNLRTVVHRSRGAL